MRARFSTEQILNNLRAALSSVQSCEGPFPEGGTRSVPRARAQPCHPALTALWASCPLTAPMCWRDLCYGREAAGNQLQQRGEERGTRAPVSPCNVTYMAATAADIPRHIGDMGGLGEAGGTGHPSAVRGQLPGEPPAPHGCEPAAPHPPISRFAHRAGHGRSQSRRKLGERAWQKLRMCTAESPGG